MRIMPFMKRKKGVQFAGIGLDTGGGGGGSYVLPPATYSTLGGVKVGTGLEVAEDGTLSSSGGGGGLNYSSTPVKIGVYNNADVMRVVIDNVVINDEYNLLLSATQISTFGIAKFLSITGVSSSSNFSNLKALPYGVGNNALNFVCEVLTPGESPSLYIVRNGSSSYGNATVIIDYVKTN